MDERLQDHFDVIKTEPGIGNSQTMHNKPRTFKNELSDVLGDNTDNTTLKVFEYQTTEQFGPVEVKEEIVECEVFKIEQCLDLPTKIDQGTVTENVQIFPKTIKQEFENTTDVKVTVKEEVSEYMLPITEGVVSELLTSECDLPTLKIESTDYYPDNYLGHSSDRKSLKNNSHVILKKKRRRYECPVCQNNFLSSKSRSTHIDGHFEKRFVVCQFCGRLMTKNEYIQHFFIHVVKNGMKNNTPLKYNLSPKRLELKNNDIDDKLFECGTCFKTFNRKSRLKRHLIIHNGEKKFKCDICSKEFNRNFNLKQHLIIHSGEKPFECDICSKNFSRKSHLRQHLIIHRAEMPYKCDICSKSFLRKSHWQQHLFIHKAEKPFKCDICFKGFTRKSNLQEHFIIHGGDKPFKCDICSKAFMRNCDLQRHLLIHSGEKPFMCDICSKGFTQKHHLQIHLIVHSGLKPFKCDICSKCFNGKSNLKKHLIIHNGSKKSFKCDICSKGFNQKPYLQRHLKIHNLS